MSLAASFEQGVEVEATAAQAAEDAEAEAVHRQAVIEDPMVWLETCVLIEDKKNRLVAPVANRLQGRLGEYVRYCREHKLPMRLVIPKARQRGVSTGTVGIAQWLQKVMARHGLIVGGKDWQVDSLWSMYRRFAETDTFNWGFSGSIADQKAEWGNGSTLKRQTAGGKDPGRSATIQVLVGTEVAYWGHDESVKSASKVLTGLLAAVPNDEDTLVVLESTSSGGAGLFYRYAMEAVDMDAFLAGARSASGFVRLFLGVFEFPDVYSAPRDQAEAAAIMSGVGARNEAERVRERELRVRHNLNAGQIKRWRELLAECDNDPEKRDREYPPTLEDAFRSANPSRFNRAGLMQLRDEARRIENTLEWGILEQPHAEEKDRFVWRLVQEKEDANIIIHEHPRAGLRYSIQVDTAGGRATGDDPHDTDCHAVTVLRNGYFDTEKRKWMRPAVVASIKPKQRVDIDILEEWVWRLHVYYGRCLVVPEANNDRGLILLLRNRGCLLYEQERPATQTQSHKPSGKLGFWTRGGEYEGTRRWIIENMARAVRELDRDGEGIFIPFLWILDELDHFATDPDTGKAQAMTGWHDDWVIACCIGLATMGGASMYQVPVSTLEPPEDVAAGERAAQVYEAQSDRV